MQNLESVNCNFCNSNDYKIKYIKNGFNIVQCNKCKLIYVNPRLSQESISQLYNEDYFLGKGFDKSINLKSDFERDSQKLSLLDWDISTIKEFLSENNFNNSPKLLDVGCGMGLFLFKARNAGFNVQGLELSKYASEFAGNYGIPVINSSIDETNFDNESFDAITMREVIEHLPDPFKTMKKTFDILKPNGVLFITTGNYDCPERKLKGKNWNYFMPEGHLTIFSHATMKNFLTKVGFRKILITNQGDLLMNFLLKYSIIEPKNFKPKNPFKKIAFELVRAVNHFISSGMRIYAIK